MTPCRGCSNSENRCITNTGLVTNLKHSIIRAPIRKTNSIAARLSAPIDEVQARCQYSCASQTTNTFFYDVTRVSKRGISNLCICFCIDSDKADVVTAYPVSGLLKYQSLQNKSVMLVQNS